MLYMGGNYPGVGNFDLGERGGDSRSTTLSRLKGIESGGNTVFEKREEQYSSSTILTLMCP